MHETLVENLDDRLFNVLRRPGMHFLSPEAMLSTVFELLTIRQWAVGAKPPSYQEVAQRMGFLDRAVYRHPDRITDDMVERLRAIAIEQGHEPGDRPARAAAWKAHWSGCPACKTGSEDKQCVTGAELSRGLPRAWRPIERDHSKG